MPNMPAPPKNQSALYALKVKGYRNLRKIVDTLQGSIWRATDASKRSVVIKMTDRLLHSQGAALVNGQMHAVCEDILMERQMLKHVTSKRKDCPPSVVRYIDFFKTNKTFFLVMEDGGHSSLLEFCQKAHQFIEQGQLTIAEWHKCCKIIFAQMLEAVQFLHSLNVCHYDVSLENFLISDVDVVCYDDKDGIQRISFVPDTVQIKLCDFGLSAKFQKQSSCRSRKFVGKPNYYSPEITAKETFNAKKNDVWCIGVCLFMAVLGGAPFGRSRESDAYFMTIMRGDMVLMLKQWKRAHYVTSDLLQVLESVFEYETKRADIATLLNCAWLN